MNPAMTECVYCALSQGEQAVEYLARALVAEAKLAAATALLRDWSNFDFDCPDEYDAVTGEEQADGWALEKLYEDTVSILRGGQ